MELKSSFAKINGLGSAKSGDHHWWMHRVTALANIPLVIWFVVSVLCMNDWQYSSMIDWVHHSLNATLLILLLTNLFYHSALGVQVVVEDYVKTKWLRKSMILGYKAACIVFALYANISILKIVFGG